MNRPSDYSSPLIFRPATAATPAPVPPNHLVVDARISSLAGPDAQLLANGVDQLAGVLVAQGSASLEEETYELYREMFAMTRGLNRYRIWNYLPRINAVVDGVENYQSFNAGRYRAFMEQFGGIFAHDISAASALGTPSGSLTLAFVAGSDPVRHYENPLQTPAAHYPERYGKKSPLFARGSVVDAANGTTTWHLSGTASVRNSETIGCDFDHQLKVTMENIDRMLGEMAVPAERQASWKVFLRHRRNLDVCRQRLAEAYPNEIEQMMFLEADICRSDLLLEIEGIFHAGPAQAESALS